MSCRLPSREGFKGSQGAERGCHDLEVIAAFGNVGAFREVLAEKAVGTLAGSTLPRDVRARRSRSSDQCECPTVIVWRIALSITYRAPLVIMLPP
jgi:hypothetical protein